MVKSHAPEKSFSFEELDIQRAMRLATDLAVIEYKPGKYRPKTTKEYAKDYAEYADLFDDYIRNLKELDRRVPQWRARMTAFVPGWEQVIR